MSTEASSAVETASPASPTKPVVFFLSLERETTPWFDEMYRNLIDTLSARAHVQRASKPGPAIKFLTNNSPSAVIVTDPGVVSKAHKEVLEKVQTYASQGGTVIFGCNVSSFIKPMDLDKLWGTVFNLPWRRGDYHRTTVHLSGLAARTLKTSKNLASSYSQKAVFLQGVDPSNALYLPTSESTTESHVFPDTAVDAAQTPVAWTQYEKGWVGYVGDVNAEAESSAVIVAMCGL